MMAKKQDLKAYERGVRQIISRSYIKEPTQKEKIAQVIYNYGFWKGFSIGLIVGFLVGGIILG